MNRSRNYSISDTINLLVKISRPRFWMYLGGPVLIAGASALALDTFYSPLFWYFFLTLLFPANILLYGINDISDGDTDKFNTKKTEKEIMYRQGKRKVYFFSIGISLLCLASLFLFTNITASLYLILFIILSYCYSAKPFRFKARPFLDFTSNILYVLPGFAFYALLTGENPPLYVLAAVFCWTCAMHLFSAVPDVEPDKKAGLTTSAVFFGYKKSLIMTAILWTISSLL